MELGAQPHPLSFPNFYKLLFCVHFRGSNSINRTLINFQPCLYGLKTVSLTRDLDCLHL